MITNAATQIDKSSEPGPFESPFNTERGIRTIISKRTMASTRLDMIPIAANRSPETEETQVERF